MLRSFRSHAKGFFSKIILALLIVSFAVWGIGDMVISRPGQAEIAKVGKVVISRQALEKEMQHDIAQMRERMGERYKPEMVQMLQIPQQVAGRMVAAELMRQETEAMGLTASEEAVAESLRANPMFHGEDGKFSHQKFVQVLAQNNLMERDFVAIVREDMARRLIGQAVTGYNAVPDIAVKVMQAAAKEVRNVTIYAMNKPDTTISEPTDEELASYYETVSSRYASPEYRQVSYVTVDEKDVAGDVQISKEKLQAMYQERLEEYQQPELRDLQMLLYNTKEEADAAKAMLASQPIKDVIKAQPPINPANTAMKKAAPTRLPEELQAAAFALKVGEVSEVIASPFGQHVMVVEKVYPPSVRSFAEVEESLTGELKSNQSNALLTQKADTLEDMLAGGSSLADAAKELGLTLETLGPLSEVGKAPGGKDVALPPLKNFVQLAFNTDDGSDSSISVGRPGVYYLLHVDKVTPEVVPPLAEVKTDLVKTWMSNKRAALAIQHARNVAAKLADPKQRDAVLASSDLRKLTAGKVSREDLKLGSIELPVDLAQNIFAGQIGDVTNISQLANGSFVVATIEGATLPPLAEEADKDMRGSIQNNQQQELMEQFMRHLYSKYDAVIHQEAVAQIGREQE